MFRFLSIGMAVALLLGTFAGTATATQEKVTICHAAGQAGTTKFVTLTIGWNAAFGQAGHFYENGTPRAGHEQDYLGACQPPQEPEYDVDADVTICGDPRAVFALANSGDESVGFTLRFTNAFGVRKSIVKTVLPDTDKYLKRWVLGKTMVTVTGGKGELLDSVFVNRKNNIGPCAR